MWAECEGWAWRRAGGLRRWGGHAGSACNRHDWMEGRTVAGKGLLGRQECRPQSRLVLPRMSAPQKQLAAQKEPGPQKGARTTAGGMGRWGAALGGRPSAVERAEGGRWG